MHLTAEDTKVRRPPEQNGQAKVAELNAEGILCAQVARKVNAFGILRDLCANSFAISAVKCRRMVFCLI